MPISQPALQGILKSATEEVFLDCLTITHSDMTTLRLVNDTQDLTRSAGVFSRFPFIIKAAEQSSEQTPAIAIRFDAVDQRVLVALRSLAGKRERAQFTYEVVLASSPNTIESGPATFEFNGFQLNGPTSITVRASFLANALNDAFPAQLFSPSNAA